MSASKKSRVALALACLGMLLALAGGHYEVKPGDTLSGIARRFRTTVPAIADANGISNPDLIFVGQSLQIPTAGGGSGGNPTGGKSAPTHVVAAGDTLASIAARYGTTIEALARANGIANPNLIFLGTRLRLQPGPTYQPKETKKVTHVVKVGETLSGIAARFGTSSSALAAANGIADPDRIVVGAKLVVSGAGWVCPVPNASYFNDWGFPRSGGRFHEGNDLYAPRGTAVLAPVSGTVERIVGKVGGLQFWLHGSDGTLYIGSHLDAFGEGGDVEAGTVIGYVGDSGNAVGSRPHLHFEIHPEGGEAVNPYPTLKESCG